MSRVVLLLRKELLELRRQPCTIAVVVSTFALLSALLVGAGWLLDRASRTPATLSTLDALGLGDGGALVASFIGALVPLAGFLLYSQLLGMVAVFAGQALLHERQLHTWTFLLLAPLSRAELIAGKVLGALLPTLLVWGLAHGAVSCVFALLPAFAGEAARLPPEPAFFVSWWLAGPLHAASVAVAAAGISGVARDVRAAQQAVWFLVLFATLIQGFLVIGTVADGVAVQLGIAALGAVWAGCVGAVVVLTTGRDLARG